MPDRDLPLLIDAARRAGVIALRHWKRAPQVWDKGPEHGPVTEADLAVDAMLRATLLAARPDHGWLSEETPDTPERQNHRRVFIVDPIDGTRAFIAGEDSFAHSIAVAEDGRVTAGVVYLPALDRLYAATIDGPATRDGTAITASTRHDLTGADVLTTRAGLAPEMWPGGVPDVRRSFRASLAFRLCLAAEGRHDAMLTFRDAWEWDIAAGTLIAARAGCVVTDRLGVQIAYNAPHPRAAGVVCAPPDLHGQIMNRLRA